MQLQPAPATKSEARHHAGRGCDPTEHGAEAGLGVRILLLSWAVAKFNLLDRNSASRVRGSLPVNIVNIGLPTPITFLPQHACSFWALGA